GFLRQAIPAEQPAQTNIDELRNGVEHAAESILGDGTEALRLAQRELQQLSRQLDQGMAGNTNGAAGAAAGRGDEQLASNQRAGANRGGPSDQQAGAQDDQDTGEQNGRPGRGGNRQGQAR